MVVTGDARLVPGGGVDLKLSRPQVEPAGVDLGGRSVAQPEVQSAWVTSSAAWWAGAGLWP